MRRKLILFFFLNENIISGRNFLTFNITSSTSNMMKEIRNNALTGIKTAEEVSTLISGVNNNNKEYEKFMKYSPLVTLMIMTLAPLTMFLQALGETIDMMMISKRFANEPDLHAIEIIGFSTNAFDILTYIGMFFGQALIVKVSSLIGEGERDQATLLTIDMIRIGFLFTIIFAICFNFAIKPLIKFVGCPDNMVDSTYKMMIPLLVGSPILTLFAISFSFLQSIGSSIPSALEKLAAFALQSGIFTPLLLFGFKTSTTFMRFSVVLSQFVVSGITFFLIFKGKFSLKLPIKYLFGKFCKETPNALLLAFPLIIQLMGFELPPILILKSLTAANPDASKIIGGAFGVFIKVFGLLTSLLPSIGSGYLSCATHAFGYGNMKRLISYFFWALLFGFLVSLIPVPIMIFKPRLIAQLFLTDEDELALAEKILPIPFYTSWLSALAIILAMTQLVVGKPLFSLLPNFIQVIIQCVGCQIAAKIFKNEDSLKIMYIYNISDVIVIALHLIFMIYPIKIIRKKVKESQDTSLLNSTATCGSSYSLIE